MEPLVTIRRCLIWLCVCPADKSASRCQKLVYAIFSVAALTTIMCGVTCCSAYFWKFVSVDFQRAVFAFMFAAALFTAVYMAVVAIMLLRIKIERVLDHLSTIYKENEKTDSFRFLVHVNNNSEWMCKTYADVVHIAIIVNIILAPLISVLYSWFKHKNLNVENFFHPLPYVYPWNQTIFMGYVAETSCSIPIGYLYFFVSGGFLLLFVSICQHHQAFQEMFANLADNLKRTDVNNNQCDAKILCDLMRFHISVKNWFLLTADVYSPFIAVQLICGETLMAISIFIMDSQFQQHNTNVITPMSTSSMGITYLLIYCYLGKLATESYAKMADCVFDMKWYGLPNGLQRFFILMITNVQKPLYYHGLKVIYLNLETFTKLFKSAITYYMAIKAMT